MDASWRDINIIQHDVAANTDGWAEGGEGPLSLYRAQRHESPLGAARLHAA